VVAAATMPAMPKPRSTARRGLAAALLAAALSLAGCSSLQVTSGGTFIDSSLSAKGQDSRVLFLIIHYTVLDLPGSIKVLTENEVSSHYLLTDETRPRILRLVDENRRAWHAGVSGWRGNRLLNSSSIGIEIVHPGARVRADGSREYLPFPQAQIDVLIPLVRDIVARHGIRPERVLGHGEIQPFLKQDPGPTFPWKQLADAGITPPWPDAARVAAQRAVFEATPPDVRWWQSNLERHGYEFRHRGVPTGVWDDETRDIVASFQMRYRPARYDGQPDAETAALLHVVLNPAPPQP
jgi:N-acetylmuramoyl-L-alanine amidase